MWSQRDPALRKTGQGNIFIKNLDDAIDNKVCLNAHPDEGNALIAARPSMIPSPHSVTSYLARSLPMNKAAPVAMAMFIMRLLRPPRPPSRLLMECFSMIRRSTLGIIFLERSEAPFLSCTLAHVYIKERQSKLDEMRSQFTNLYVKNIDSEVTADEFVELFEKYGTVTSAVIQFDDEGRSKGFGFVNFDAHEQAQAAVEALHDFEYKGKKLFVSRAQKKAEREDELRKTYEAAKQEKMSKYQGVNLYIKNLEDDIDDEKLRAEFEPFGTITSCKVMCDEKGTSKGFGFVCFSSPDEATKAVADMNNKIIGTKPLYVSLAQRREVRRQQLESQIAQRNQIRLQQAAAAGIPGGYLGAPPVYYPPGPGPYPPQSGRGIIGYPQPSMLINPRLEGTRTNMMSRHASPCPVWSGASARVWQYSWVPPRSAPSSHSP